ncbi:hypothetical protein PRIPAC_91267 [Pristionchus pacificus]|uniref:G protein-coupled receptor n=1 Tax=Pristionchus pacificus TaxID=54126 RepID=A0A2A6B6L8_PRIPA|nr:hypothetical protein PRIPAC_91267 [Pristionchus pacificus]|eukprot:PDM61522.1 G protein-coupled receptor [Pristionchus pacificus]
MNYRNANEISAEFERFASVFFYCAGSIGTFASCITFYLLLRKRDFWSAEMRTLMINLQFQAFLSNFHFCILFTPFLFPFVGGGYCNGLLCLSGVGFHANMVLFLLFMGLLCAAFIVVFFGRFQTLLIHGSLLKVRLQFRIGYVIPVFYIYTHLSFLIIPALFFVLQTPLELQLRVVHDLNLSWEKEGKVFNIVNREDIYNVAIMVIYSLLGNLIIFGSLLIILLVLTLRIVANARHFKDHSHRAYRAKIKNALVIITQLLSSCILGIVPICIMVATVGINVGLSVQTAVVLSELCIATMCPIHDSNGAELAVYRSFSLSNSMTLNFFHDNSPLVKSAQHSTPERILNWLVHAEPGSSEYFNFL